MNFKWITKVYEWINKIPPETRSAIIFLLFGYILFSLITEETKKQIAKNIEEEILLNKKAELYSMETSVELNLEVQMIAEKDTDAFDVLLLNYHNNTLSLLGYKYLYLSCLTEAPLCLDTPLLKQQWNKIDYIYYADELARIHALSFVPIEDVESMGESFPKLYRLVKTSGAKAITFFTIEGSSSEIGMIVILYKESKKYDLHYPKVILPHILKLAILLDYESKSDK